MSKVIQTNYGGITCFEVNACIKDYFFGKVPYETAEKVDRHFQECEKCKKHSSLILEGLLDDFD